MLQFSTDNTIFQNNLNLAGSQIGMNASRTRLVPFQLKIPREDPLIQSDVVFMELASGNKLINMSADVSNIYKFYDDDFVYLTFFDTIINTDIPCGLWQLKIWLFNTDIYYSNYMNISDNYKASMFYYQNKDFDGRIYQYGYKNKLYIETKIVNDGIFKTEQIIEKGDGSKKYEYQNFADIYKFVVFGDRFVMEELSKIELFENVEFTWREYENEQIFDRASFEFDFQTNLLNYKGEMTFSINPTEKKICQANRSIIPPADFPIIRSTDGSDENIRSVDGTVDILRRIN